MQPGAVTALQLGTGDELTVIDVEGRQRGELTAFDGSGEDYRALGATADTTASVLRAFQAGFSPRAFQAASRLGPCRPPRLGRPLSLPGLPGREPS